MPVPRPTAVSNAIQASVMPSASEGGSVVRQPLGRTCGSWDSSIARISAGPSSVLMFQVKATRSRQKPSSPNSSDAATASPSASACSKRPSQSAISAAAGSTAVSVMRSPPSR